MQNNKQTKEDNKKIVAESIKPSEKTKVKCTAGTFEFDTYQEAFFFYEDTIKTDITCIILK